MASQVSQCSPAKADAGNMGSIPGLGRSPGEGNGNPLQYSCLENPMEGGAWQATVHGVAKSWTRLSNFTSMKLGGAQVKHLLMLNKYNKNHQQSSTQFQEKLSNKVL